MPRRSGRRSPSRRRPRRARRNPALEREAQAALLDLEELPEPWVQTVREARRVGVEEIQEQLMRGAIELSDRLQSVLVKLAPQLGYFSAPEQESIIAFFLVVPRAVRLLELGLVDEAQRLRNMSYKAMVARFDPQVRDLWRTPAVQQGVYHVWEGAVIWIADQLDANIEELVAVMFELAPQFGPWLLARGVTQEQLFVALLEAILAGMPATYYGAPRIAGRPVRTLP